MFWFKSTGQHQRRAGSGGLLMLLFIAVLLAPAGCGKKKRVPIPAPVYPGATEKGVASWYGYPYHGRRTANGEIYDMEKLTAAHRTLPFNTWVRVLNRTNGRTVDVRINDRGPFVRGRIIDLSRVAARRIDMIGPGTAKVKLEILAGPPHDKVEHPRLEVPPTPPAPALTAATEAPPVGEHVPELILADEGKFAVQVGAFSDQQNAEEVCAEMAQRYGFASLMLRDAATPLWRVIVGRGGTRLEAEDLSVRINEEYGEAFVVRLDENLGEAVQ